MATAHILIFHLFFVILARPSLVHAIDPLYLSEDRDYTLKRCINFAGGKSGDFLPFKRYVRVLKGKIFRRTTKTFIPESFDGTPGYIYQRQITAKSMTVEIDVPNELYSVDVHLAETGRMVCKKNRTKLTRLKVQNKSPETLNVFELAGNACYSPFATRSFIEVTTGKITIKMQTASKKGGMAGIAAVCVGRRSGFFQESLAPCGEPNCMKYEGRISTILFRYSFLPESRSCAMSVPNGQYASHDTIKKAWLIWGASGDPGARKDLISFNGKSITADVVNVLNTPTAYTAYKEISPDDIVTPSIGTRPTPNNATDIFFDGTDACKDDNAFAQAAVLLITESPTIARGKVTVCLAGTAWTTQETTFETSCMETGDSRKSFGTAAMNSGADVEVFEGDVSDSGESIKVTAFDSKKGVNVTASDGKNPFGNNAKKGFGYFYGDFEDALNENVTKLTFEILSADADPAIAIYYLWEGQFGEPPESF